MTYDNESERCLDCDRRICDCDLGTDWIDTDEGQEQLRAAEEHSTSIEFGEDCGGGANG